VKERKTVRERLRESEKEKQADR
jgi:hypothetical protein